MKAVRVAANAKGKSISGSALRGSPADTPRPTPGQSPRAAHTSAFTLPTRMAVCVCVCAHTSVQFRRFEGGGHAGTYQIFSPSIVCFLLSVSQLS